MDSISRICAVGSGTVASSVTLVTSALTDLANASTMMTLTNCSTGLTMYVKLGHFTTTPVISSSNFTYKIPAGDWLELSITGSIAVWIRSESGASLPFNWQQVQ